MSFSIVYLPWETTGGTSQKFLWSITKDFPHALTRSTKSSKFSTRFFFLHTLFNFVVETIRRHKSMARLKIFDDALIYCIIDTISVVDKKSVKKPILALTRTIIRPKKSLNKESQSACNILNGSTLYCFMP